MVTKQSKKKEKAKTPAKKKAKAPAKKKAKKDSCFAIMPFSNWFDDYYEQIYIPAIEAAGLNSCRADDLYRPSTIVHDIWNYTKRAKIVLADLTGKNPNVFYELGLAHALAKPAILVAETMDDVPFDLRSLRVIVYDKNETDWGTSLKRKVTLSIKEVLESPLESVLPAFVDVKSVDKKKKSVSPHEKEIMEIKQDLAILRRELRIGNHPSHRAKGRRYDGPKEATLEIKRLIEESYPTSIITKLMREGDAPPGWIEGEIKKIKRMNRKRASEKKNK